MVNKLKTKIKKILTGKNVLKTSKEQISERCRTGISEFDGILGGANAKITFAKTSFKV